MDAELALSSVLRVAEDEVDIFSLDEGPRFARIGSDLLSVFVMTGIMGARGLLQVTADWEWCPRGEGNDIELCDEDERPYLEEAKGREWRSAADG